MSAEVFELERVQTAPVDRATAFAFFANPWNLEAITPPWLRFQITGAPERLERGSRLSYVLRLEGVPVHWLTEIDDWRPGRSFTDVQLQGPYRSWIHTHRFTAVPEGTEIYDHVAYRVPGGSLSPLVQRAFVAPRLEEIFDYRAGAIRSALG